MAEIIDLERLMLDSAVKSISCFPYFDIQKDIQDDAFWRIWERVPGDIKIAATNHWTWTGAYLDAYFRKQSDPLPNSGQTELEQAIIRTYARYYLALYDVLFNGERFIKAEAKKLNISYPFQCVGDLFYGLVFEDILSSLEPCLQDHWEGLPAQLELECIRLSSVFWKGERINPRTATRLETQIKKAKKLQLQSGRWSGWNLFCRNVAAKNRDQLQPSLTGLGIAYGEIYRLWSSHKSPACDSLRKIIYTNGMFRQSPIGKNRRKSLT